MRTMADLIDAARARLGELTLASTGPASPSQIAFEMLKRVANVQMTYVPFRSNAPTVNAVLGGHHMSLTMRTRILAMIGDAIQH
jgi:tripartite-type tricarboxylate transporter receptor subunit TctC